MIHVIKTINDPLCKLILDDPVRPEISIDDRIYYNKEILVLLNNNVAESVICVSYQNFIPRSTEELISSDSADIAIFYTIWSYKPGSGRRLIFKAKDYIKEHRPEIKRFITLSPQTFTASRFHTNNGAKVLRVNKNSVNYEYT